MGGSIAKLSFGLYRDETLTDAVVEDFVLNNEVRPLVLDLSSVESGKYFLGVSFTSVSKKWYEIANGKYCIVGLGK